MYSLLIKKLESCAGLILNLGQYSLRLDAQCFVRRKPCCLLIGNNTSWLLCLYSQCGHRRSSRDGVACASRKSLYLADRKGKCFEFSSLRLTKPSSLVTAKPEVFQR